MGSKKRKHEIKIDAFLDVKKTNLPPCEVCGSPASGSHYGVFTCEACKVFFRRSAKKFNLYKCNGRKNCSPDHESVFACRYCRYQKCLTVGMCLNYIKHGRYSREKKIMNDQRIAEVAERRTIYSVARTINYTDADEMVAGCVNLFAQIRNVDWDNDFPHLKMIIKNASDSLQTVKCPLKQYVDILDLSGFAVDQRRIFGESVQQIIVYTIKRWNSFSKKLPGLRELDEKQLFRHLSKFNDMMYLTVLGFKIHNWHKDGLLVNVNNNQIKVKRSQIENLWDVRDVEMKARMSENFGNLNPTFEELTIIIMLFLIKPTKELPQFQEYYNKLTLGFTRFLQSVYHDKYNERMTKIVEFITFSALESFKAEKWKSEIARYYDYMYSSSFLKDFWFSDYREKTQKLPDLFDNIENEDNTDCTANKDNITCNTNTSTQASMETVDMDFFDDMDPSFMDAVGTEFNEKVIIQEKLIA